MDRDEGSWISSIYNAFSKDGDADDKENSDGDASTVNMEELDPPNLDNSWDFDQDEAGNRAKRSSPEAAKEEAAAAEIFEGSGTCQTKYWRCLSGIMESGLEAIHSPGGLAGYDA